MMDLEELWEKAKEKTEIVRGRVKGLSTVSMTTVPYIFLAESSIHEGHTVVRKGKIIVEKPMIILPREMPQFEGFDFEEDLGFGQDIIQSFFLMRGIRFPSMKYNNTVYELDVEDLTLAKCSKKHRGRLEKEENISTALVLGPEECWQFSLLLYMASLVGRCVRNDILNLLNRMHRDE
ncbi:MAG: hypothetical protein HQL30_06645 [Candidatus Omnitrophica bacterium]|nr:hypothetical protein [Candidatus Omnitrophota bacterium]